MFRAHESWSRSWPDGLSSEPGFTFYNAAELLGPMPIWLLQAAAREPSVSSWQSGRRLAFGLLADAISVAGLGQWRHRRLYVLLPEHVTGSNRLILSRCIAVTECSEPLGDDLCWRIETESGTFLWSFHRTPLGKERTVRIVWAADDE
ncbi:hypothetical protein [Pelomonas sp. KK5]|uniref:hypothetical protein n=1 Tax=Pelomonas sp. KK5 TaxID=1855730 RepID=UPI001301DEEC|nr:hypothetical protein [Pelomonas sp. KK5]